MKMEKLWNKCTELVHNRKNSSLVGTPEFPFILINNVIMGTLSFCNPLVVEATDGTKNVMAATAILYDMTANTVVSMSTHPASDISEFKVPEGSEFKIWVLKDPDSTEGGHMRVIVEIGGIVFGSNDMMVTYEPIWVHKDADYPVMWEQYKLLT